MSKTDDEIEKERDAVQKMVGAKSAMEAMLRRHDRLVSTLSHLQQIADDLGRRVGEDLMIRTYFHGERDSQQKTVSVKDQLARMSALVREVK